MDVIRGNARPTAPGPAAYFTGAVWRDEIRVAKAPSDLHGAVVNFMPGARTAWHTHPRGQVLFVVSGVGRVQLEGHPVREIRPGDTVVIAAGERHWHGAAPDHIMAHVALQEADETGTYVVWQEQVSDADYLQAPQD